MVGPDLHTSTMSRYVRELRDLGVSDARAIEALARHIESLYTASAKLHRALAPYGGTAHAVLSRASAPDHDPDADEVCWVAVFDGLGLFNMSDRSRMIDALFRYIWRHHEADMFVTQLAAIRPGRSASRAPVGDDGRGGPPLVRPTAPSPSNWIPSPTPPATVRPTDRHLAPMRDLISAIDKVANPAVLARKVATCALLALYQHVYTTHYSTATVEEMGDDGEKQTSYFPATGHRSGNKGPRYSGQDPACGGADAADAMQVDDGEAAKNTGGAGAAAANAVKVDDSGAVNNTGGGGAAAANAVEVNDGGAVNSTGGGGAAAAKAVGVNYGGAVNNTGGGGATAANAVEVDDGGAVNKTGGAGAAAAAAMQVHDGGAVNNKGGGGAAAANAVEVNDGGAVNSTGGGGAAAANAVEVNDGGAVNNTGGGGAAAPNAVEVDDSGAVNNTGGAGAAAAAAMQVHDGGAVNNTGGGGAAAAYAVKVNDGGAVSSTGGGSAAAANAVEVNDGGAVNNTGRGGAAAANAVEVDDGQTVNKEGEAGAPVVDNALVLAVRDAARLFLAANETASRSLSPRQSPSKAAQSSGPRTSNTAQRQEGGTPSSERKMKYLSSHFKCTWWPSYKSDTKVAAPTGTLVNLLGDMTVLTRRSSWAFHVELLGLKGCLEATSFARLPVFKMSEIENDAVVVSLTNMARRPLIGVFAVLLLVSVQEPTFSGILTEIVSGKIAGVMDLRLFPIVGGVVQVGRGVWRDNVNSEAPDGGAAAAEQDNGGSVRARAAAAEASTSEMLERKGAVRNSTAAELHSTASSTPGDAEAGGSAGRSYPLGTSPASLPSLTPAQSTAPSAAAMAHPGAHPRGSRKPAEQTGRGRGAHVGGRGRTRAARGGLGSDFRSSSSTAIDPAYHFKALPPTTLAPRNMLAKRRVAKANRAGKLAGAAATAATAAFNSPRSGTVGRAGRAAAAAAAAAAASSAAARAPPPAAACRSTATTAAATL